MQRFTKLVYSTKENNENIDFQTMIVSVKKNFILYVGTCLCDYILNVSNVWNVYLHFRVKRRFRLKHKNTLVYNYTNSEKNLINYFSEKWLQST